ncbi:cyclin-like protein [Hypomontagnella monticulosa]|nr:cyclin-like protein [Hypomontagnella monticulosa]
MDAKPYRFTHTALHRGNNENINPVPNKTIHQRYKSTSHLANTMPTTSNISKPAAKSSAMADFTNRANPAISAEAISKGQENQKSQKNITSKDGTFLQPAQRPPKSLITRASTGLLRPGTTQFTKKHNPAINVYHDDQSEKESLNKACPSYIARDHCSVTSYESKDSDSNWTSIDSDQFPLEGRLQGFHVMESPKEGVQVNRAPSNCGADEDDIQELVYMDAVEELPSNSLATVPENVAPEHVTTCDRISDSPALYSDGDNALGAQALLPDYEMAQSNLRATHSSAPVDNGADLSEYEDEDYDDQGYATAHSYRDNTTCGVTTIMMPSKLTSREKAEIEAAHKIVASKIGMDDSQTDEDWDISMVTEYGNEIFAYMKDVEATLAPGAHYMDIQTEIKWSMRAVLMDWVIQVHTRFGLLPETLFLAVNYIDRFLSVKIVSIGKLQLVGATALLLAAKYEEINCPSIQEIVYMVDGGYTQEEILKAERFMLSMLNFELGWPGPMSFLRRVSKADDYDSEIRTLAKYFLEVTVMDERFVASPPSFLAAGAQCLARTMLAKGGWTPEHVHYSGYTFSQLKSLVGTLLDCCRIAPQHHRAVFEKYTSKNFKCVSTFVQDQIANGFKLSFQPGAFHYTSADEMHSGPQSLAMPIPLLAN